MKIKIHDNTHVNVYGATREETMGNACAFRELIGPKRFLSVSGIQHKRDGDLDNFHVIITLKK